MCLRDKNMEEQQKIILKSKGDLFNNISNDLLLFQCWFFVKKKKKLFIKENFRNSPCGPVTKTPRAQ